MIIFRQAIRDDLERVDWNEQTAQEIPDLEEGKSGLIDSCTESFTIFDTETDEIFSMMGIKLDGEVGHVWAVFSEHIKERGVGLKVIRVGRRLLEWSHTKFGLKRVDMIQRDGNLGEQKWARIMGFDQVGVEKDFLDGHDYLIYAKEWADE